MSLFKKPSRKFRVRTTRDDTDEEENSEPGVKIEKSTPTTAASEEKSTVIGESGPVNHHCQGKSSSVEVDEKKNGKKTNPKLSFEEEEEETDIFQVKKSAYSRRIAKQMKREKKRREKEDKQDAASKKEEKKAKPEKKYDNQDDPSKSEEEPFIISVPDFEEPDRSYDPSLRPNLQRDDPVHEFKSVLQRGVIPDAKTIYALKKQRQMARNIDEFIAIETETAAEKTRLGLDDEAKSDFEEGDEDDDEDEDGRIDFAIDKEEYEKERNREAFLLAQEEEEEISDKDGGDSEEELDRWEREQIRKGVGSQVGTQRLRPSQASQLNDLISGPDVTQSRNKSSQIPNYLLKVREKTPKEEIVRRLKDVIAEIQLNLDSSERELKNVISEREESLKTLQQLETNLHKVIGKYEELKEKHLKKAKNEDDDDFD